MEDARAGLHRVTMPSPACLHARPVDWGGRDQGRQADRVNAATFGLPVLVTALAAVAAVLSSRLSERLRIPAPAFFLFAAAASLWPGSAACRSPRWRTSSRSPSR
jgi:predicted kinase